MRMHVLFLLTGIVILSGCTSQFSQSEDMLPEYGINMSFIGEPKLDNIVELLVTMNYRLDYNSTEIQGTLSDLSLFLPEEFEIVEKPEGFYLFEDELYWRGSFAPNEIKTLSLKIKPRKIGVYEINATSHLTHSSETVHNIILNVQEESGIIIYDSNNIIVSGSLAENNNSSFMGYS